MRAIIAPNMKRKWTRTQKVRAVSPCETINYARPKPEIREIYLGRRIYCRDEKSSERKEKGDEKADSAGNHLLIKKTC